MSITTSMTRTNQSLFVHHDNGSPHDGLMAHLSALGPIGRLDFERCAIAGDILFAIEADAVPVCQQDEEARIGSLGYAIRKLRNPVDAAEFVRCLNVICEDGDARSRQTTASYYFNEIALRGVNQVLKEMALLALQLSTLNAAMEILEVEDAERAWEWETDTVSDSEPAEENLHAFFHQEVNAIARRIRGRRKSAGSAHDEWTEWINDIEANGASIEELDAAFAHLEALDQFDEGGAILMMSSHERTVVCGRIDPEYTALDLPERAFHLASDLRRDFILGVPIEDLWEDLSIQLEVMFPISAQNENGARFYSHANRALQMESRRVLEALLEDCQQDFHLVALRTNHSYREYHRAIRTARDTRTISATMQQAYEARQTGKLPLKQFVALKTAADLQRERLSAARPSAAAMQLLREINTASESRLRYLSWAFYGNNQPDHVIHKLSQQDAKLAWDALKARKAALPTRLKTAA